MDGRVGGVRLCRDRRALRNRPASRLISSSPSRDDEGRTFSVAFQTTWVKCDATGDLGLYAGASVLPLTQASTTEVMLGWPAAMFSP